MLDIDKKPEQQGYAALAIGTAFKDVHFDFPYDFQLWSLQSDVTHPSELILKTNNITDKNYNENLNEFENKIDNDGKNDLTGKLNTGIGKNFSFGNDNHDIQNQINVSDDDKSKNNNDNDIDNNDDKISGKSDKHYDDDNENDKFSLIPVTKNQTMSSTKNQNNSNVNNDDNNVNKNENIQKSMTGIEKLVSLLYHSTNNESFIMQNGPYLDELQRNVMFAILSAARENGEVQENLCKVKKSDFSVIENGDINKNESSSVGGKINIDQSIFMNYLIKIAEQSNRNNSDNNNNDINNDNNNNDSVSYELTRNIWNFIALILQECAMYRNYYSKLKDLSEKEKEEWSNMEYMGDFFLTEFWFNLAGKAFENFFHLYTVEIEKNPNWNFLLCDENGEIIHENNQPQNTKNTVSTDLKQGTLRLILDNVIMVEKEIIIGHEMLKLKLKDEYKKNSNSFLMTLNALINLKDSECGSLKYLSRSLLEILA